MTSATTSTARAYWVREPGVGSLREVLVESAPRDGHSLVQATISGVSPGTERLVGLGLVPESCGETMACPYMDGDFRLPVKYGYDLVGTALSGALAGRRVFVMHPHQELAMVADDHALALPDDIPDRRAALIPCMETALNACWDGEPVTPQDVGPVAVIGGGLVGLLVAYCVQRLHDTRPTLLESDPRRRELADNLPWVGAVRANPDDDRGTGSCRLAFQTTGTAAGLQAALDTVGFEGRVIDLSWYGSRRVELDLGSHFHHQRKRIIASQVGSIAPSRRATHGFRERLDEVIELLRDERLDLLAGPDVPFEDMPEFMSELYRGNPTHPLPVIQYSTQRGA